MSGSGLGLVQRPCTAERILRLDRELTTARETTAAGERVQTTLRASVVHLGEELDAIIALKAVNSEAPAFGGGGGRWSSEP